MCYLCMWMEKISNTRAILSLSPLAVFLGIYLVSSLIAGDFYGIPVSAAFLLACIYALAVARGPIKERVASFSRGAGNGNVLLMIWIFILAGAFAGTAKDIGAVDATVNLALKVVPPAMLYAGFFLTSCFISLSIGTSVGTIVALVPIASGLASQTGIPVPFMTAIIVGGAFFGDNLSFISDTTIAATRAVGCEMKDKFKANLKIVAPAVAVVTAIYLFKGASLTTPAPSSEAGQWFKMIPYILIIVLALCGRDVLLTLSIGIAANAVIGLSCGDFTWGGFLVSVGSGIASMSDLIVVTMLAGGLLGIIRDGGGLDWAISKMTSFIKGPRGAQASIAALVSIANICTANNTIAIITTGEIASDISKRYGVDPRKAASIMDTFSCLVQGFLPYGAQLMMASALSGAAATSIISYLYYPFLVGICAIASILIRRPCSAPERR